MKTKQKLVRKYRLLKPSERIRVGDYYANSDVPIEDLEKSRPNWIQLKDPDDFSITYKRTAGEYAPDLHWARFVDCIPVNQTIKPKPV